MWMDRHDKVNSRFTQFCEKRLNSVTLFAHLQVTGRRPQKNYLLAVDGNGYVPTYSTGHRNVTTILWHRPLTKNI
jgi:hypothetical protein